MSIMAVGEVTTGQVVPHLWGTTDASFTITPSCSMLGPDKACLLEGADPGVMSIRPTVLRRDCGAMQFDVTLVDTTFGTYRVTPRPGTTATWSANCTIEFIIDVLKLPVDADPMAPGWQTLQIVTTTHTDGTTTSSSNGTNQTRVSPLPTVVDTTAPREVVVGSGTLTGTASLFLPGFPRTASTVVFNVYGPDDADCSGAPAFTSTVPLGSSARLVNSAAFTPTHAGDYRWVASYSGDANNVPESSACHDAPARTVVHPASPTITTAASPPVVLGSGTLTNTANVSGLVNPKPGATVTFVLYGPDDADCTGSPAFTSTVPQPVSGAVTSGPFTPVMAGTYRWIASYSGDSNNNATSGVCNATGQNVTVSTPSAITASASPSAAVVWSTRSTVLARVQAGGVDVTGGFVNVYVDDTLEGRVPVADGTARLRLPVFRTIGRRDIRVEYTGVTGVLPGSEDRVSLVVEKARPHVSLALRPEAVHQSRTRPRLVVAVTAPGQTVSGDVLVRAKGELVARLRLTDGKARVRLPRYFGRGLKAVHVRYQGSATAHPSSSMTRFRVVR